MKRKLACALGVLLFWTALYALGSYGAARDVDSELLEMFDKSRPIIQTDMNAVSVTGAATCMTFNRFGSISTLACSSTAEAAGVIPASFILTKITVEQRGATGGDVTFCTGTLLDSTLTAITEMPAMRFDAKTATQNTTVHFLPTEQFVLEEGAVIYMNIDDPGADVCNSAAGTDPYVIFTLWGVPLEELK